MRRARNATRRLGCESLEQRMLMVGNVSAAVVDGLLQVVGDNSPNYVVISQGSRPDEFIVDGRVYEGSDSRINGSGSAQRFRGVTQGV